MTPAATLLNPKGVEGRRRGRRRQEKEEATGGEGGGNECGGR